MSLVAFSTRRLAHFLEHEAGISKVLEEPIVYVTIKGQKELHGTTSLWEMTEECLWNRIEQLKPDGGQMVATIALDLPTFEDSATVEGYGVVSYVIEECNLQAPIECFQLTAADGIDKSMTPRHSPIREKSILAIKAVSVEKIVSISLEKDVGSKLLAFLDRAGFNEIFSDIHVSKNTEILRYCIIEILLGDSEVQLRISSRSTSQLNIIMHTLRDEFPEMTEVDRQDKILEAAIALEREIELRLRALDSCEILNASIVTDLLIPELS